MRRCRLPTTFSCSDARANKIPVAHQPAFTHYAGERKMPAELLKYKGWTGKQTENRYSH